MSEGNVDIDDVIQVLRANGISVEKDKSGDHTRGTYILNRQNQLIEAIELPKQCRRRLLHTLARKYQIEIRQFFFREQGDSEQQQKATAAIPPEAGNAGEDAPD